MLLSFLFLILEDNSRICGATNTPTLDFWSTLGFKDRVVL